MTLRRRQPSIDPSRVYLGKVIKPHGLKGEVKLKPFGCDFALLQQVAEAFLEPSGQRIAIEHVRGTAQAPIVKFTRIDDRNASEAIAGELLWLHEQDLPPLEEDTFYEADFLFARVVDERGAALGHVESIIETGETDVLVIRTPEGGERMLPATKEVVIAVQRESQTVVVRPPLDMDDVESKPDARP